ncbi:MAG TPA: rRNA maturation RNase YbeY [Candidatus Aquilonibacter sp.]|jgi:probable rRNA maturation factor|nr:rRNA maturation RNase YbeY [Candidatus Aquilonibacter sp.]
MQTMQLTALEGRRAIHKRRGKLVILRKRIAGLSAGTLERFVRRARRAVRLRETVNVLVTSSGELRVLNRRFRGKDKATDILSFPSPSSEVLNRKKRMAGELAISADIARENAEQLGHSVAEEIKILVLHGILHLAGFDHEQDHGEMAREENRLRRELRLESGLIERSQVKSLSRANRLRRRPTQLTVPRRRSA